MSDRDINTVELLNSAGPEYAANYGYVWFLNMLEFTVEVSVGANCINF